MIFGDIRAIAAEESRKGGLYWLVIARDRYSALPQALSSGCQLKETAGLSVSGKSGNPDVALDGIDHRGHQGRDGSSVKAKICFSQSGPRTAFIYLCLQCGRLHQVWLTTSGTPGESVYLPSGEGGGIREDAEASEVSDKLWRKELNVTQKRAQKS